MTTTATTLNGREQPALTTLTSTPPPAVSISRASHAALGQALTQALELAQRNGLDASSAALARGVPAELASFRTVLEQALQHLTTGNAPAATALLQQVLGPAFELDQNQIALETAVASTRTALTSYQSAAPAAAPDPRLLTNPEALRSGSAAAEQVALAFDDLAARALARAELLVQFHPS